MSAATSGPAGLPTGVILYSNPRVRERGKFGPCLRMVRRLASSPNRDRTSLPTGRPNEVHPDQNGGFGTEKVGRDKIVFAPPTEIYANLLRRKKKKKEG